MSCFAWEELYATWEAKTTQRWQTHRVQSYRRPWIKHDETLETGLVDGRKHMKPYYSIYNMKLYEIIETIGSNQQCQATYGPQAVRATSALMEDRNFYGRENLILYYYRLGVFSQCLFFNRYCAPWHAECHCPYSFQSRR